MSYAIPIVAILIIAMAAAARRKRD